MRMCLYRYVSVWGVHVLWRHTHVVFMGRLGYYFSEAIYLGCLRQHLEEFKIKDLILLFSLFPPISTPCVYICISMSTHGYVHMNAVDHRDCSYKIILELKLQVAVSCPTNVGARIWTWVLRKSNTCSQPLLQLCSPSVRIGFIGLSSVWYLHTVKPGYLVFYVLPMN